MRISDWSSDVCSSDLLDRQRPVEHAGRVDIVETEILQEYRGVDPDDVERQPPRLVGIEIERRRMEQQLAAAEGPASRSEARRDGKGCVSKGRSRWSTLH